MITDSFHVESPRKRQPASPVIALDSQTHKHQLDCNATTINHHPTNNNIANKNTKTLTTKENNLLGIPPTSCSTATSESGDNLSLCDGSLDSLEVKMWHKSETESMAPSCSSISLDSSSDEVTFEFMRRFISTLFTDSVAITLELKHQFGQYARVSLQKFHRKIKSFSQLPNRLPRAVCGSLAS
jgi:hypothetical protein